MKRKIFECEGGDEYGKLNKEAVGMEKRLERQEKNIRRKDA